MLISFTLGLSRTRVLRVAHLLSPLEISVTTGAGVRLCSETAGASGARAWLAPDDSAFLCHKAPVAVRLPLRTGTSGGLPAD